MADSSGPLECIHKRAVCPTDSAEVRSVKRNKCHEADVAQVGVKDVPAAADAPEFFGDPEDETQVIGETLPVLVA
jgi:hypothetical protein